MVCGHCVLLFQFLDGNNSILWLHNIHHRLLVLWCSISVECQWMCVKGKLLGMLIHHVHGIVVLHMHHLMHLCTLCSISLGLDSVRMVLWWPNPWVLRRCCDGLVSTQILLVDELAVSSVLLFLQSSWWIYCCILQVQGMHILILAFLVYACSELLVFFDGSGFIPFVLSISSRYWISSVKKWHLLHLIDRCVLLSFLKTCSMLCRCSCAVWLKMMMSSK